MNAFRKFRGISDRKLAGLLSASFNNQQGIDLWARQVNQERRYTRVALAILTIGWFALATAVWM